MDRAVGGVPGRARLGGIPEAARCICVHRRSSAVENSLLFWTGSVVRGARFGPPRPNPTSSACNRLGNKSVQYSTSEFPCGNIPGSARGWPLAWCDRQRRTPVGASGCGFARCSRRCREPIVRFLASPSANGPTQIDPGWPSKLNPGCAWAPVVSPHRRQISRRFSIPRHGHPGVPLTPRLLPRASSRTFRPPTRLRKKSLDFLPQVRYHFYQYATRTPSSASLLHPIPQRTGPKNPCRRTSPTCSPSCTSCSATAAI